MRGADLLRQQGYSEEQIAQIPENYFFYKDPEKGGAIVMKAIGPSGTLIDNPAMPRALEGHVQIHGTTIEVQEPGYAKTSLTENEIIIQPSENPAFVSGGIAGVEQARAAQAAQAAAQAAKEPPKPYQVVGTRTSGGRLYETRRYPISGPNAIRVVEVGAKPAPQFMQAARQPPAPFGKFRTAAPPTISSYMKAGNILQASGQIIGAKYQDLEGYNWKMTQANFMSGKLGVQSKELSALGAKIDSQRGSLNLNNAEAVAAFNKDVEKYNSLREKYNSQANEVNFILKQAQQQYPTIYKAATVLQAAPSATIRNVLAQRGLSKLETPPPKPTIIGGIVETVMAPARTVWDFIGPTAEAGYGMVSPYAKPIKNFIWRTGEQKGEEIYFATKGRELLGGNLFAQGLWGGSGGLGRMYALERNVAIEKGNIPMVEKLFGLPTEEAKFRAYGGTSAEIGTLFIPGGIGLARNVVAALSLPSAKEAAKYAGTGFVLGALFKGIGRASELSELGLGAAGFKGAQKGWQTTAMFISKYGMPAVSVGFVGASVVPIVGAIERGEPEIARQWSGELAGGLGAMQLGGIGGSFAANRLTRELEMHILKMQTVQKFKTPQTFTEEGKSVTVTKETAARTIDRVFWETRGKAGGIVEDLPVEYLKALKGEPMAQQAAKEVLVKWGGMGVVPFGSTTQYGLLKGIKIRTLGDIDAIIVKFGMTPKKAVTVAQDIFKKYGLGERFRVTPSGEGEFQTGFLTKAGVSEHLFSIHKPGRLFARIEQLSGATEFFPFILSKTKSGYFTLNTRLQWKTKIGAGYIFENRVKDILDLETIYKGSEHLAKQKGLLGRLLSSQAGEAKGVSVDLKKLSLESQLALGYYGGKMAKREPLPFYVQPKPKKAISARAGYDYGIAKATKTYLPMFSEKPVVYAEHKKYKQPMVYSSNDLYKELGYAAGYKGYEPPETIYEYPPAYKPPYKSPKPPEYDYPLKYEYKAPYAAPYKHFKPYKAPYEYEKPYKYPQPYDYKYPKEPPTKIIVLPMPKGKKGLMPEMKFEGFEVWLKKSGKFIKISKQPLAKLSALGLGSLATETSTRTFVLRPTKEKGTFIPELAKAWRPERFRAPFGKTRLPKGAFVEKTKYAIDVPQELKEITYKGIAARKGRRSMLINPFGAYRKKSNKNKRRKW